MLLRINDKEYGLVWGQLAFERMEDTLGISGHEIIGKIIDELANKKDRTLRDLAYEAIRLWCFRENVGMDLSYFDFVDWLDQQRGDSKEVEFIGNSFKDSWYQGKQVSEWIEYIINLANQSIEPEEKVKKKATTTRASKSSKTASSGGSKRKSTTT